MSNSDQKTKHRGVAEIDAPRFLAPYGPKIEALGANKGTEMRPKRDPNEAKMEPWRAKSGPKVDKSGAKGEVWDHM